MRIRNIKEAALAFLKIKLFYRRIPLAVRWQLTNKCIFECKYCDIWNTDQRELSLEEIVLVLDQLSELGTQTISFSGGEPMLRSDIGLILEETKKRKISTEMNSTGATIAQNISKLRNLDFLKISLDGPEEIHDLIRGRGAYRVAIEAAEAAKDNNLNFIFTTTLTKFNVRYVEPIIGMAKKYNTLSAFQPLKNLYHKNGDINSFSPSQDEFREAITKLIRLKRYGNEHLRNSLIGLRHIYNWPHYGKLKCWAGRVFCIINTDGQVLPCDRISYNNELPNCLKTNFKDALLNLPCVHCSGCGFCGVLELNFLLALKLGTISSILKVVNTKKQDFLSGCEDI